MKICFLGYGSLPVLAKEYNRHGIGGEQVQQTLLAKALRQRGHEVSMVVYDYGQPDRACWDGVMTYRAFSPQSGIPVLRYVHPRWTGTWNALRRANAQVYYASCAGMQVGLLAMFCSYAKRRFVYRAAHDSDCDPQQLLVEYWRDRKLYEYGLRRANGILVQSEQQQRALQQHYGLQSHVAQMLVDPPRPQPQRDIDVLWVNNLRPFKRPDLYLVLARMLPHLRFHMVGGPQPGHEELYAKIRSVAATQSNIVFHGQVPYHEIAPLYARARVFVNTSDSEGFPNSYLQAWVHGTPVVAFFDPDSIIEHFSLGKCTGGLEQMAAQINTLAAQPAEWSTISENGMRYMQQMHDEEHVLAPYLKVLEEAQ